MSEEPISQEWIEAISALLPSDFRDGRFVVSPDVKWMVLDRENDERPQLAWHAGDLFSLDDGFGSIAPLVDVLDEGICRAEEIVADLGSEIDAGDPELPKWVRYLDLLRRLRTTYDEWEKS